MDVAILQRPDAVSPPRTGTRSRARSGRQSFRSDIEGLRAVAVLSVLAFHASVPGLPGGFVGVDVFFVISGYLITGQLTREVVTTGRLRAGAFYARRARRLVPPAALMLATTGLVAWFVLPRLAVFRLTHDLLASLFYVANWQFIAQGKDYLAGSTSDSPVLHMWSLAVEEQFYLAWPFVILLAGWLAVRSGRHPRVVILTAMVSILVVSLALSIHLTRTDPATAYMATYTRAWQFAVGGVLALTLSGEASQTLTRHVLRSFVGLAGLAALVWSLVAISDRTPYPGLAALVPTLGAAALIGAGTGSLTSALLSLPPVRLIGRLSYSWYLWHWPALILSQARLGVLDWEQKVGISLGSLVLAAATYYLLERPTQRSVTLQRRTSSAAALGVLSTGLSCVLLLGVGTAAGNSLGVQDSRVDDATFSKVFGTASGRNAGPVTPSPLLAAGDVPAGAGCLIETGYRQPSCRFGVPGGKHVILFGDSHAHQWLPAFRRVAKQRGWELDVRAKSGCPIAEIRLGSSSTSKSSPADCARWRRDQLASIIAERPYAVVFSSYAFYIPEYAQQVAGWRQTLTSLSSSGAQLVYLRDTPHPPSGDDVPECVSSSLDDWSACAFKPMSGRDPIIDLVQRQDADGTAVIDLNGYLCGAGATCPAVRNGTLLYRDDSHISATAARLLTPAVAAELTRVGLS